MNPIIPVFIASPGDVEEERRLAERATHAIAPRLNRVFGVTLVPILWKATAPISAYDSSHPQYSILRRIEPYSIFIGILWNRHGTPVKDSRKSGTEMEFDHALAQRDSIAMLTYFRKPPSRPSKQARLVRRLRARLLKENVKCLEYSTTDEFESRIAFDIFEAALELILSKGPKKVSDYVKIFRFSSHARQRDRPLLIVYPPLSDPGPGHKAPALNWCDRLLPHIVYEDSKAIQDLEEAMRLLGREYKTVTTDSPDLDLAHPGDRIWVCLPRNSKAKLVLGGLRRLGVDIRFSFSSRGHGKSVSSVLRWKHGSGEWQEIRSPLKQYLQRSNRDRTPGPWRPRYGYSYGRDYAVFARFRVPVSWDYPKGESSYHYFVGGIRGLGTWGVGHLIDHQSSALLELVEREEKRDENDSFQLLLEITYENYRITRVRDTTNWTPAEFKKRSQRSYIETKLKSHSAWRE